MVDLRQHNDHELSITNGDYYKVMRDLKLLLTALITISTHKAPCL